MGNKTIVTLFLILFAFSFTTRAQNISQSSFPNEGEFLLSENDADHPCISEQEYKMIERICTENRITYHIPEVSNNKTEQGSVHLDWPLQAAPGLHDCSYYHISAYVDQDTMVGTIQDFDCGTNTYDGHKGTDISIWPYNFIKMDNDLVEVIAACSGTILAKHDGEFDRNCSSNNLTANYVMIQHSDGSVALYWHMKNGSITATAVGQPVLPGDHLGVVGSSGSSTGPHLHFEVWSGSTVATRVDPYSGNCNLLNGSSWWNLQKAHKETGIMKVSVNTTDIVMPPCPTTETSNESSSYQIPFQGAGLPPGYAKFYIFIRDELNGLTADVSILNPDSSTYLAWTYTSSSDNNARYWGWSKVLPTNPGTYTFQATYNGITCSTNFDITVPAGMNSHNDPTSAIIYPNPSDGNFVLELRNRNGDEIEVFNVLGEEVFRSEISNSKSVIHLQVQSGLYFYLIKENDQIVSNGKLVVR